MKPLKILISAGLILTTAACTEGTGSKEAMGTLIGAGLGALAGSQIGDGKGQLAAVAIGALAGAYIGREVGKSLDRADRAAMQDTTQSALENGRSGRTSEWHNPDSGHSGSVTPQPAFTSSDGRNCREFQQTVQVDGETVTGYGTACRQEDGTWRVVNTS